jgi:hypothetical protein
MGRRGTEQTGRDTDWSTPTDIEDALLEARSRADWDAYLAALQSAELFIYVYKDQVDGGTVQPRIRTRDSRPCLHVHTRGVLLREPQRHLVAVELTDTERLWKRWKLSDADYVGLLVNPGTPTEAYFPGSRALARRWHRQARRAEPRRETDVLLTLRTGILTGPLAHGLACGAHLAVRNAVFWNDVGDVCTGYEGDTATLSALWEITDHETWREQVDFLLEGSNSPPEPEFLLRIREALAGHRPDEPVTAGRWREAALDRLLELNEGADQQALADMVTSLTGTILRYEARFRADGVLPSDGRVRSALAYDYGRAVNVARWGRGARLATTREAEEAVLRAGELCASAYGSWAELSAGYILGRALRFDEEAFGEWYQSALTPHRILTEDPESPWHTVPFTGGLP